FQLELLVPVDVIYRLTAPEAPKRPIKIKGYICIEEMERIRKDRKAKRDEGGKLMKELGLVSWSGDIYFDYCGLRWMMEGKWGLDHPSSDPSGVFWSQPNIIYDIYD
ncbi:hypothetical protein PV328_012200, partial [Microctonus aethiopoides]